MSGYAAGWYWCDVVDRYEREEPDWSKVPEFKREAVRQRWLAGAEEPMRCQMWGPQIGWYQRQPNYTVSVVGPVNGGV